eukprot:TRINITY_DN8471_c0_g1_i1.p1 TRINITY_DN8471_c0_g1~~TRINITY_DN8471_c0_g1_i1.p1  ORF type:complete len:600 (+),score=194.73 TRINITY_DN8471_c0_g1_i1:69-1868(+)
MVARDATGHGVGVDVCCDATPVPKQRQREWNDLVMPIKAGPPHLIVVLFLNLGVTLGFAGTSAATWFGSQRAAAPTPPPKNPERPWGTWVDIVALRRERLALLDLEAKTSAAARRAAVRGMFLHAWKGYREQAWGEDELVPHTQFSQNGRAEKTRPRGGAGANPWGGWGITLVDALDTMALMGLNEELKEATEFVAGMDYTKPPQPPSKAKPVSMFETTIRHLGGLLGAYTLTRNAVFLDKATQLGNALAAGFTGPRGFNAYKIDLTGKLPNDHSSSPCLADAGSLQMEFTYLSMLTGNRTYARLANRFYEHVYDLKMMGGDAQKPMVTPIKGLYPKYLDHATNDFKDGGPSIGGQADSFYEYLLKVYLLTGATQGWLYELYTDAVDALHEHLILTDPLGSTYISASRETGHPNHRMDHLSCFAGAMLALGVEQGPHGAARAKDLAAAKAVTETCYRLYEASPTKLGPEIAHFSHCHNGAADCDRTPPTAEDGKYQLRPETLESLYYLWLQTKDPKYREWAWAIFTAIETHCWMPTGYTGVTDVQNTGAGSASGRMESFFLAETLKYAYLIFLDENPLPHDEYVFNTEAHPFRRMQPVP